MTDISILQTPDILKRKWQYQAFIDEGLSKKNLSQKESEIWTALVKKIEKNPVPPPEDPRFKKSKLIAYGWEWAVYLLSDKKTVIKVLMKTLPIKDVSPYFDNVKTAYSICKKYIPDATCDTHFSSGSLSYISQPLLTGAQFLYLDCKALTKTQKVAFKKFVQGLLQILEKYEWLPDVHITRAKIMGKERWSISRNVMLTKEGVQLFDFSSFYDVFRLYPERTKVEVKERGKALERLVKELSMS